MPPVARAQQVRPAGAKEQALLDLIDEKYDNNVAKFARAVAKRTGKTWETEKSSLYRIIRGERGRLVTWRLGHYAAVLGISESSFLEAWAEDEAAAGASRRSARDRLADLEENALTLEDLQPLLRVVQLLAVGKRAEAQRALSEAGLAPG